MVYVYASINKYRTERELSPEEVDKIFWDSAIERRGHAVYGVEEIIVSGWERKLWAYRIGEVWTYVPKAFEGMALHWAD